jgi:hypothetical protein
MGNFSQTNVLLMYTTVLSLTVYKYAPNLESLLTQQYVCVMCTLWSDNTSLHEFLWRKKCSLLTSSNTFSSLSMTSISEQNHCYHLYYRLLNFHSLLDPIRCSEYPTCLASWGPPFCVVFIFVCKTYVQLVNIYEVGVL